MKYRVGIEQLIKILIILLLFMLNKIIVGIFAEARRAIPDDNLAYPVLVKIAGSSIGSGFFLKFRQVFLLCYSTARFIKEEFKITCFVRDRNFVLWSRARRSHAKFNQTRSFLFG